MNAGVTAVQPFRIRVPDEDIADLRMRLERARFSPVVAAGRGFVKGDALAGFVREWRDFDWRPFEARVNALPQVLVTTTLADIHVIHVKAAETGLPLVLTHGWPSSFVEFLEILGPLSDPQRYGGDPADAFDVIIPSLPGFGYSTRLSSGPTTPAQIAALWVEVRDALGYQRFGAYGGDIGAHVTNFLGAEHPEQLVGVFTHHPALHPNLDEGPPLRAAERAYLDDRAAPSERDDSYAEVQASRPDALAAGLADSPAGLASWVLDKYREWSDDHSLATVDPELLQAIVSLYWFTNSIGTSFLPYLDDDQTPPLPTVTVPAGIALTSEDAAYPREFGERTYADIRMWRGPEAGGHFLALENPQRLVRDLRDFFRPLRGSR